MGLGLLAGIGAAGSAVALTATSAWLISRAAQQPPVLHLMVAIVAVRTFGISRGVFRYGERLATHDAAFRWLGDLRAAVFERLERLAPAGTRSFRSGDLMARFVGDVDSLQDLWLRVLLPYLVAIVVAGVSISWLFAVVPAAALAVLASLTVAAFVAPWAGLLVARRAERSVAPLRGRMAAEVTESLAGSAELAAFGADRAALDRVSSADRSLSRAEGRGALGAGLGSGITVAATGAGLWLSLVAAIAAVRAGELSGVALAVIALTPLALAELVLSLAPAAQQVPRIRAAAARVFGVLDTPAPVHEPEQPSALPTEHEVDVADVRARWEPDSSDVLRGVSLGIAPGERRALVGPSGSGKSTLAAVLLRFLDPSAGTVTLGGVDTTRLHSDDVRTVVGLLPQQSHLFDTSVRENLLVANRDADDATVRAALARARLLTTVDALPEGIDTLVGENGARLSGGERQRLALARVLLADFDVLVLDEPTEHLDEETAQGLLADLLTVEDRWAVLLITHRETDELPLDDVIRLEHGRVLNLPVDSPRPS